MTHQFNCGHEAGEPEFMGRGAARQQRLNEYFDRNCRSCTIDHLRKYAATLNTIVGREESGKWTSRLKNEAEVAEYVAKRAAQLRY